MPLFQTGPTENPVRQSANELLAAGLIRQDAAEADVAKAQYLADWAKFAATYLQTRGANIALKPAVPQTPVRDPKTGALLGMVPVCEEPPLPVIPVETRTAVAPSYGGLDPTLKGALETIYALLEKIAGKLNVE